MLIGVDKYLNLLVLIKMIMVTRDYMIIVIHQELFTIEDGKKKVILLMFQNMFMVVEDQNDILLVGYTNLVMLD